MVTDRAKSAFYGLIIFRSPIFVRSLTVWYQASKKPQEASN